MRRGKGEFVGIIEVISGLIGASVALSMIVRGAPGAAYLAIYIGLSVFGIIAGAWLWKDDKRGIRASYINLGAQTISLTSPVISFGFWNLAASVVPFINVYPGDIDIGVNAYFAGQNYLLVRGPTTETWLFSVNLVGVFLFWLLDKHASEVEEHDEAIRTHVFRDEGEHGI